MGYDGRMVGNWRESHSVQVANEFKAPASLNVSFGAVRGLSGFS